MVTAASQRLETANGNIDFLDVGSGIPTLYFHGTGAGNDGALLLEQSLIDSNCRLIIPNRPGYYGTTLGPAGSADFCATLAAELLDHLSVKRVAVIGTSGGGMPAASFARCYPDRTAALILQCAQSHRWSSSEWLPKGLGPALYLFHQRIFSPLLRWQNSRHAKRSYRNPLSCMQAMSGQRFPELRHDPRVLPLIADLTNMTVQCAARPAGIQNDWAILIGDNGISTDTIGCPTLIIHDEADPLVPFAHAVWSQSCIADARLLRVHAGGHLIWFGEDSTAMHNARMDFIRYAVAMKAPHNT